MEGVARLRRSLADSSGDEFQQLASGVLSAFLGPVSNTRRLGELDKEGIDAFNIDESGEIFSIVIQYKGFEKRTYGADQQKQCRRSISKFASSNIETKEYWIVVNRSIRDGELRSEIEADLASLIDSGRVSRAVLYDFDRFIILLRSLSAQKISKWAELKRTELFNYYSDRLAFVEYIDAVPFSFGGVSRNPCKFLLNSMQEFYDKLPVNQAGANRHAPQFLVTSSFGFGKTSTLHALAREWVALEQHLIYVPAAVLGDRAFSNGAGLANEILKFILPDGIFVDRLTHDLLRDVLKIELSKSLGWILLIDGVDESRYALNSNCIFGLSRSIAQLGMPTVLAARSELVDSRPAEFRSASTHSGDVNFHRISLLDWPDNLIVLFVTQFEENQNEPAPEAFREFKLLMMAGRYEEIYGDIPKRPLFLGMLIEDAWSGKMPERELHRLYGSYFRKKFQFDRFSMAAGGTAFRVSNIVEQFGVDEACERLMLIMQRAALEMARGSGSEQSLLSFAGDTISEEKLSEISQELGILYVQFEDIVMHSLLQPAGRDDRTRVRTLKFAHRSFQDWFLARQLAIEDSIDAADIPESVARFLGRFIADRESGVPLP